MTSSSPWASFSQDPRRPEAAALRAADRDRDVVLGVLAEGYADGRLTKDEYDERAGATAIAKTLGELPVLILDLVPGPASRSSDDLALASPEELHARAVRSWQSSRRQAFSGLIMPSLVCWVIWVITGFHQGGGFDARFPWPVFVMLGTGANLVRVLVNKQEIVLQEQQRLERKQRKALEGPKPDPRDDG
jgi:hypothetical protein